jgi:hypothetical protein
LSRSACPTLAASCSVAILPPLVLGMIWTAPMAALTLILVRRASDKHCSVATGGDHRIPGKHRMGAARSLLLPVTAR